MSQADVRRLTNHFQDVRLIGLRKWKAAAEISPRDQGGPYMVAQEGYNPADLRMQNDEFVLGQSGRWLSVGLFLKLPIEMRRAEFIFGTAAEVIQVMQDLPSHASVLVAEPESQADAAPEQDELNTAFIAAKQASPNLKP